MSTTVYLTTIITLGAFMLGTVLGVVYFIGSRIEARLDRFENRIGNLEAAVQRLSEDVAVLKATAA